MGEGVDDASAPVPRLAPMTSPDRAAPPAPPAESTVVRPVGGPAGPVGGRVQVVSLRPEGLSDAVVESVAGVLAAAFLTDPYMSSFLPADHRRERLAHLFVGTVREALRPASGAAGVAGAVDVAVDSGDGTLLGAAVWDRPGAARPFSVPAALGGVRRLVRATGRGAVEKLRTEAACRRARPDAPHWYLLDVGTAPPARGRGAGRLLVERRLRDARGAGVGVYLESATRATVPFYERLGFAETGRIRAHGTEDLTGMWWEEQA